ncbi:MAG: hypothetical protein ACI4TX_02015, partial [Christensenellales bacterium]
KKCKKIKNKLYIPAKKRKTGDKGNKYSYCINTHGKLCIYNSIEALKKYMNANEYDSIIVFSKYLNSINFLEVY